MRLVLDTNTAISGLLWHGTPGKLIDAAYSRSVTLCTSALLLAELRSVLEREKFSGQLESRGLTAIEMFNGYAALATIVVPAIIHPTVVTDPTDDAVLACAVAAQAELIVSGDQDLLRLKVFRDIPVKLGSENNLR